MGYASSDFANGIGPVYEASVPYKDAEGKRDFSGDWTIAEDMRFYSNYQLKDGNMLPCPAEYDDEGNYSYNEVGTAAIKKELLNGRAVSFAYHADQSMKTMDDYSLDELLQLDLAPEDKVKTFYDIRHGEISFYDEATYEQQRDFIYVNYKFYGYTDDDLTDDFIDGKIQTLCENHEKSQAASSEDEADEETEDETPDPDMERLARELGGKYGLDYDAARERVEKVTEAGEDQYINIDTYAQYTDNPYALTNHGVAIVGWDDDYSADNFLENHRPPADGAWIVRNSWGPRYGDGGYFYLSYYDMTINYPESFVFDTDAEKLSSLDVQSYDYSETMAVDAVKLDEQVCVANVFTASEDYILSYVSLMSAGADATADVSVYLLDDGALDPTDGMLIDSQSINCEYSGYHRIKLDQNYLLPEGSRYSVVVSMQEETENGTKYVLPYVAAPNEDFVNTITDLNSDLFIEKYYVKASIGEGESFIKADGSWYDWKDIVAKLQEDSACASLLSYDNLSLKAYLCPTGEILESHDFDREADWYGYEAKICDDCGYTLIEVK